MWTDEAVPVLEAHGFKVRRVRLGLGEILDCTAPSGALFSIFNRREWGSRMADILNRPSYYFGETREQA